MAEYIIAHLFGAMIIQDIPELPASRITIDHHLITNNIFTGRCIIKAHLESYWLKSWLYSASVLCGHVYEKYKPKWWYFGCYWRANICEEGLEINKCNCVFYYNIAKIFEHIFKTIWLEFLEKHEILNCRYYGFPKNKKNVDWDWIRWNNTCNFLGFNKSLWDGGPRNLNKINYLTFRIKSVKIGYRKTEEKQIFRGMT